MGKSAERRARLEASYRLQAFERDCDETKGWINEKLKFANDESYLVRAVTSGGERVDRGSQKEQTAKYRVRAQR